MAALLRLQALFSLTLATPRRLPSHLRCAAAVASPLPRCLPASASNGSPEQRASETDLESGLYLVATPIGNLEDITLRALRVLKCAHVILSEDTRHSGKLLQHYNIKTPLLSFHKFNEREREPIILKRLHEGEAIAVISDAGTPGISDPGMELARLCATEKIPVIPIPGPSAAIAALSASGLPTEEFTFARLEVSAREAVTQIFYVPPHGIHQFLLDAASSFGNSRSCVIAREITKLHEEFWRGTLGEANEAFATRQPKGEITILIDGSSISIDETPSDDFLEHELRELMAKGHALSTAVKLVAEATSAKKKDVYALALKVFGK
ncbi:ribosomal RNA small subunit methyltransferase I-like isoform X2 [Triticum dicoccoides]|uniref:ribosomal RNA small subunit methyltransferase I-like isoform X2 n=1 Tax=Triticum dicoccoides TaxID=85692 RepID=UPI00188FBEF1|nr:ribosomal RNA small subunit methyltransferase I-like isoform X2 [Triticum dicoccoides]